MKYSITIVFICLLFSGNVMAQSKTLDEVVQAMKAGNSKAMTRLLSENVEFSLNGEVTKSSKTHIEFLLRDFFKKYPPSDLTLPHRGESSGGEQTYAIGNYLSDDNSFRFFIRLKKSDSGYLIYSIDLKKEN